MPDSLTGMHEVYMRAALREARKALARQEAPIGAVVVREGRIIARGYNLRESKQDATLHAEMIAIRKACKKLNTWRLNECSLYVTLEPCAMCAGAIVQSRVGALYIGTPDPKAGAAGSVLDIVNEPRFNHRIQPVYGILQEECAGLLKDFFRQLRAQKK